MTMDAAYICDALTALGLTGENWGPDVSSLEALAAGWRGSVACPSEAELLAAEDAVTALRADRSAREWLASTDRQMARVGEDLLAALIAADVVALADLPEAAQAVVMARETARGDLDNG